MRILFILMSLLFTSNAYGKDFNYETTFWFNKINLECKSGMCDLHINGNHKGQIGYTMDGDVAVAKYNDYTIRLDLTTGDFKFK